MPNKTNKAAVLNFYCQEENPRMICLSCADTLASADNAQYWTLFWVTYRDYFHWVYAGYKCELCKQRADKREAKAAAVRINNYFRDTSLKQINREVEEQRQRFQADPRRTFQLSE